MRTTVDLPDELMREAKIAAIERGISFKELIGRALRREVQATLAPKRGRRAVFPIIRDEEPGSLRITEGTVAESELAEYLRGTITGA